MGNSKGLREGGGGVSKAKNFKGKPYGMKLNWNFQIGRGGLNQKKTSLGVWIFSG